jgi:hypothetical protein
MKDNTVIAKEYTDWHIKTGGYARDMTLRDHYAAEALRGFVVDNLRQPSNEQMAKTCYGLADAMLKERAK